MLKKKCWRVESSKQLAIGSLYRMTGNEVHVVSNEKPSENAVLVVPTLEEAYLEVFGMN